MGNGAGNEGCTQNKTELMVRKRHIGAMSDASTNNVVLRFVASVMLVVFAAGCQVGIKKQPAPAFGDYRIIGYVNTDTDVRQIDPQKLTHINFSFARLDSSGTIYFRSPGSEAYLAQLTALRSRNPGLNILLSIGGWGADYFSDAALTNASRQDFAAQVVDVVRTYDLDGIDLDWEYPGQPGPGIRYRPEDKQHFTLLLQTTRQALNKAGTEDNRTYVLSIATSGSPRYFENTEMDQVHQHVDFVNVMAFDFYTANSAITGHHTGLHKSGYTEIEGRNAHDSVTRHLRAGIPAEKVVLGVAFYGRGWKEVGSTNSGLYQAAGAPTRAYTYQELTADYINKRSFDLYWDDSAQASYLWSADSSTFISFEDPQSLKHKASYVKDQGLGGIMFWEYRHDANGALLDTLVRAFAE